MTKSGTTKSLVRGKDTYNTSIRSNAHNVISVFFVFLTGSAMATTTSLTLAWDPPATSIDGSQLVDVSDYTLAYGTTSGSYTSFITVANGTTTTVENLEKGITYYFAVSACTTCHCESTYSDEISWTAPLMTDVDADTIPDEWEDEYFQSLDAADGALSDCDLDGITDFDEFIAGTHPDDPDSYPRMSISLSDGNVTVSFQTLAAEGIGYEARTRHYTLEHCTDLSQPDWQVVEEQANIVGDNQVVSCSLPTGSGTAYYRTAIRLD